MVLLSISIRQSTKTKHDTHFTIKRCEQRGSNHKLEIFYAIKSTNLHNQNEQHIDRCIFCSFTFYCDFCVRVFPFLEQGKPKIVKMQISIIKDYLFLFLANRLMTLHVTVIKKIWLIIANCM